MVEYRQNECIRVQLGYIGFEMNQAKGIQGVQGVWKITIHLLCLGRLSPACQYLGYVTESSSLVKPPRWWWHISLQRTNTCDWLLLHTQERMFQTASSKVSDHLFSMSHLPKAQIPWKRELMLKWMLLLSLSHSHSPHNPAAALPTHTRTRHACMCKYTNSSSHTYTNTRKQTVWKLFMHV